MRGASKVDRIQLRGDTLEALQDGDSKGRKEREWKPCWVGILGRYLHLWSNPNPGQQQAKNEAWPSYRRRNLSCETNGAIQVYQGHSQECLDRPYRMDLITSATNILTSPTRVWPRTSSMSNAVARQVSTEETPLPALNTASGTQERNLSWCSSLMEAQRRYTTGRRHSGRCQVGELSPFWLGDHSDVSVTKGFGTNNQQPQCYAEPGQDQQTKKRKKALDLISGPAEECLAAATL